MAIEKTEGRRQNHGGEGTTLKPQKIVWGGKPEVGTRARSKGPAGVRRVE